ncbi:hypothetical protein SAMN04489806_0656 [Paramicrobacterium humi]|uniref:Uncharacterized protein n=1 Tax=Paramicrobacterium humi TaxID=640635 RepID=A0A1H4JE35_9MICO|nr:hypothetical protein [Microbacterium humi]SEB44619.1 hypothetical protein SAMN04489806_0656 [Microbacterium humi]
MADDNLPTLPALGGRVFDAIVEISDHQVADADGRSVCTVADIQLEGVEFDADVDASAPPPRIVALLDGPVLATRMFGGRPPESRFHRIPWESVTEIGTVIHIDTYGDDMDITWTERWMRDHVIGHIPGGRHDPE